MSDTDSSDDVNKEGFDNEGSDEDSDDVPLYVKSIYLPLRTIKKIKNDMTERRIQDDRAFVEQLKLDPTFLKMTEEMFEDGTNHVWVHIQECFCCFVLDWITLMSATLVWYHTCNTVHTYICRAT